MNWQEYPHHMLEFLSRLHRPRRRTSIRSPQGFGYAGLQRRLFAAVIDATIIALVLSPFNQLILSYAYEGVHWDGQAFEQASRELGADAWRVQWHIWQDSGMLNAMGKLAQVQFSVFSAYSFIFWHFLSTTPGKWLLRLRVVDAARGTAITDWQSAIRLLGYVGSLLPLGAGFFAIDWNDKRLAWHDRLAKTAVIALPFKSVKSASPIVDRSNSPAPTIME